MAQQEEQATLERVEHELEALKREIARKRVYSSYLTKQYGIMNQQKNLYLINRRIQLETIHALRVIDGLSDDETSSESSEDDVQSIEHKAIEEEESTSYDSALSSACREFRCVHVQLSENYVQCFMF